MVDQTILRVFIKPAGLVWVDIPLAQDQALFAVYDVWKRDGALVSPNAIVPLDAMLYAATILMPMTFKPATVYTFPTQKDPA